LHPPLIKQNIATAMGYCF